MLSKRIFSCTILLCCFLSAVAQFNEEFTDSNLNTNPVWVGDTVFFIVNNEKLQLNAPAELGIKSIFTVSSAIEKAEWEFEVYFQFNPSSSNYADIYLALDTTDVNTASGYFVRLGNTQDEVSLYRQDGSPANKTKIIDGPDKMLDTTAVAVRIKTTRDRTGNWKLFADTEISGNYTAIGEAYDSSYPSSSYFGITCKYSATRSDKFFFDNIKVAGNPKSDILPPMLHAFELFDDHNLKIIFNEKIVLDAQNPEVHFLENCTVAQPDRIDIYNDSIIHLHFEKPFPENSICNLFINSISDKSQNILRDTSVSFQYIPPKQPEFNQLLITEIMADPTPNVELPEYEYIELYNPLSEKLQVTGLELKMGKNSKTMNFDIEPNGYLILCPNAAIDRFKDYGDVLGITDWKALANNGDTLVLYNRYQRQVFSMAYQKNWYEDQKKSEGGYSLEMVDNQNPCGEKNNWKASEDPSGGTPGRINSVNESNPDLTAPKIIDVFPVTANEIVIRFNEKLLKESFGQTSIVLSPAIAFAQIQISEPFRKSISIKLTDNLETKTSYKISVNGIKDCLGNALRNNSVEFILPEKADSLDVVFNEQLFNPVPAGVDFVELINRSDKYIDLQNWKLLREKDESIVDTKVLTTQHLVLKPGEILAFTENVAVLAGQFPYAPDSSLLEANIPEMNDDEGTLILINEIDEIIDRLYYHEDFHHPLIENKEGVSLERISYTTGSTDKEVWQSAASTVGFATPGFKNSQFLNIESSLAFSIEPKVFAPDNDGYKDFTSINFELTQEYLASLFIYDVSGRVIKQILNNQNLPTSGTIIWEGDDEQGKKVNIGNYIVYFELVGINGEKKIYKDKVAVAAKF